MYTYDFLFNDTATTEIYTTDTLFPYTTLFRSERAQSVAAIFRLSGLQRDRLMLRGMGSVAPRAANDSVEGRALNRRVELLVTRSEEHTSELQSLMRISYAVFCLKKKI